QRHRGVADPRVAVVPVAVAARGLRQRRRRRGRDRAGGRERQALEGQRAALQVAAPRVVGEAAPVQPVLPVVDRPDEPLVRLLVGRGGRVLAPRQRDEAGLALRQQRAGRGERPLEPDVHVGGEPQVDAVSAREGLVVPGAGVLPAGGRPAVVEHRHAVEPDLDLAVHAPHHPQQDVVGGVVRRGPAVGVGTFRLGVPRPHGGGARHPPPGAVHPPGGLQHHGAGDVAPRGGHLRARRADPEVPGVAVQQRAEHAGRVHAGQAHPLDVAARRDQGGRLAVGQEAEVGDGGERVPRPAAGDIRSHELTSSNHHLSPWRWVRHSVRAGPGAASAPGPARRWCFLRHPSGIDHLYASDLGKRGSPHRAPSGNGRRGYSPRKQGSGPVAACGNAMVRLRRNGPGTAAGWNRSEKELPVPKFVYDFTEGNKDLKDLLGGKGANLAEMTNLGLPVPPGFTITTEACRAYLSRGVLPDGLDEEITRHLTDLEEKMGKRLGQPDDPLLVSVRSGAKFSMPGMMETVLNIGLNDESVHGLAKQAGGDERFAWDSYRRLIQMFGKTVLGIGDGRFEEEFDRVKGSRQDYEVTADELRGIVETFKDIVRQETGGDFPTDPREQMDMAIKAVFESWNAPRAVLYRRQERIPADLGTAVTVCTMVFGNCGMDSGTGVAFTRDPGSGRQGVYGDYLQNAQGEDVVAGIRNTLPLQRLEEIDPASYRELLSIMEKLENHYRDLCDIEFTIERGKLWMLQTRVGKRTPAAAFRI